MAHLKLNNSAPPSLAERVGFLIYRLSRLFRSRHLSTTTTESVDALATPYEEKPSGLIYYFKNKLITLFNKLVDVTLKVIEPIYPFTTEYSPKSTPMRIIIVDKLKDVPHKLTKPILDLSESIYLSMFHSYLAGQRKILTKLIEIVRKWGLVAVVIIVGYLLSQGVLTFSPRHIVVYTLLPICIAIIVMKPIYGLMLYLVLSISTLQFSIWNFPRGILGMPLFLSTPLLFATILSWLLSVVKEREKFRGIYDSNNRLIIGFWGFLTLSAMLITSKYYFMSEQRIMYDYLAFANCLVMFFVIIYVIGNDRERFFYTLYTVAGIYGYFAFRIIRRTAYYGFGTSFPVTTGFGGQLGDNNELAACLTMAIPIFYALFLCEKTKAKKAIFLITFVLGIVAVIYTRSRGGLLGLAVLSIPLFFKLMLFTTRNKVLPIVFILILVTSGYGLFHEKVNKRIESIKNWQDDGSAQNRIFSIIVAWNMMKDSPILGQGAFKGITGTKFREFFPDEVVIKTGFGDDDILVLQNLGDKFIVHNAYASLGGQFGIPSLMFFIWLIFHSTRKLRRLRKQLPFNKENDWVHYLSHALELSILAYAVTAMFLNNPHQRFIYIVYALTSSLSYLALKPTRRHNVGVSLAGLILFGLWLYYTVWYRA